MNDPKKWRERIDRSKRVRNEYIEDKEKFVDLYTNKAPSTKRSKKNQMQVNYIYSHIRLVTPTIFAGNPRIKVRPRFPMDQTLEENAKNLEACIHYWVKEKGGAAEFKSALFDSFFGLAAIEVGWDYKTQLIDEMQPLVGPDGMPLIGSDGLPVMQMAQVEKTKVDEPFIRWRDSRDIILDVDVPRRKDGRFMIVRDVVSHQYFMEMSDIPRELREKVKPTVRPEDAVDGAGRESRDYREKNNSSDKEWVELEWIWNRENMTRCLITPSLPNEYLLETDWPYDIEYEDDVFPVTILDNIVDNRYPYSYSEFRPPSSQINALNRIRGNMDYHIKSVQPKFGYKKGALTRAQLAKWAAARPDEAIEMQDPGGIILLPMAQFPPELAAWNSLLETDVTKTTGLIEYEGAPQAQTATEASILEGRSQSRKRSRSTEFESFVVASLAKLGQILQQYQTEAVAVQIDGARGNSWRKLSRDEIQGEFLFDIEPGIMEFKNQALRTQQTLKAAEILAGNPHVNQRYLAEQILKALDFSPESGLNSQEEMQPAPPEAQIKFKPIDLATIPNPQVQAAVVMAALEQNGASSPTQMPPQQNQQELVNMNEGRPMNAPTELAPVEGNQVQPMSEMY